MGLASKLLTGEHRCLLDDKGRMNFPAALRDKMGDSFLIGRWEDNCLIAIPEYRLERVVEMLMEGSMLDKRKGSLHFFSKAKEVSPDKQGRILVTPSLREAIGLEKEATVVGAGLYAEIWRPEDWQKHEELYEESASNNALLREIGL